MLIIIITAAVPLSVFAVVDATIRRQRHDDVLAAYGRAANIVVTTCPLLFDRA